MVLKSFISVLLLSIGAYAAAAQHRGVSCGNGDYASHAVCCKFNALRDDLQKNLFGGVCGEEAHETLHLAFHDMIGFSNSIGPSAGGGADGSIITFSDIELTYSSNRGISETIDFLQPFLNNHNVSAGDFVQFATAVGLSNCAGSPRLQFLAGRPVATGPAMDGLFASPSQTLDVIFARFEDAGGFTPTELSGLLVSHTIARSDHLIPGFTDVPMDSTPFTFDNQFFVEIQLRGTGFPGDGVAHTGTTESPLPDGSGQNVGEVRLISDMAMARDSRTACLWQSFVEDHNLMAASFAHSMAKLALVGQSANQKDFIDCSESVPVPVPASGKRPTLPAGKTMADIEQACATAAFPTLSADPGPATVIPHCPASQGGDADNCDADEGSV